jgi:hypothetical protein
MALGSFIYIRVIGWAHQTFVNHSEK